MHVGGWASVGRAWAFVGGGGGGGVVVRKDEGVVVVLHSIIFLFVQGVIWSCFGGLVAFLGALECGRRIQTWG